MYPKKQLLAFFPVVISITDDLYPLQLLKLCCKANHFQVQLTERYKAADHADLSSTFLCFQIVYEEPHGNSHCYRAKQLKQFKFTS